MVRPNAPVPAAYCRVTLLTWIDVAQNDCSGAPRSPFYRQERQQTVPTQGVRTMNIRKLIPTRIDHRAVRLLAVAGVGLAGVGATAGAAQADTGWAVSWSQPYLITASYDLQAVSVSGAATSGGAPVIQWAAYGGPEQQWSFGNETLNGVYDGTLIMNLNSGLCLNTDGVAGDQLDQEICYDGNVNELYDINGGLGGYDSISNVGSGLYLDVSGYSWNEGDAIDLWYQNNQANQTFETVPW